MSSSLIEERLYLGKMTNANNQEELQQLGITHILTVCSQGCYTYPGIEYHRMNIYDLPDTRIDHLFEEAFEIITSVLSGGGTLLVHCFAGVSRSASIIISYIMKKRGYSFEQALQYVKERRPVVNPNMGFVKQLRNYSNRLRNH